MPAPLKLIIIALAGLWWKHFIAFSRGISLKRKGEKKWNLQQIIINELLWR